MLSVLGLSLKIASIATMFSFILGLFFAYFLNKKNIPGKNILETLLILPMILPPSVTGYILLVTFGKRGLVGKFLLDYFDVQIVFTWVGAVIASCIVSLPLMYQNAKGAIISIDPIYENAAKTLGSSQWKIFYSIILPLAYPGIISGVVLSFARAMGEFGATLMIAGNIPGKTQTVPLAIYFAVESGDMATANTLVFIMTAISFVMIFALNRWLKRKNYVGKQE